MNIAKLVTSRDTLDEEIVAAINKWLRTADMDEPFVAEVNVGHCDHETIPRCLSGWCWDAVLTGQERQIANGWWWLTYSVTRAE